MSEWSKISFFPFFKLLVSEHEYLHLEFTSGAASSETSESGTVIPWFVVGTVKCFATVCAAKCFSVVFYVLYTIDCYGCIDASDIRFSAIGARIVFLVLVPGEEEYNKEKEHEKQKR